MKTLKEAYKDYFYIGAAVSHMGLKRYEKILKEQFNSMTCENEMKHSSICSKPGRYDYSVADKMVDFAVNNGMQMRGHCMVWHNQMSDFLYKNEDGSYISRDVLIRRMKEHINEYASHFKGRINAYDVVNEAIDDKNGLFLRKSFWTDIVGDDFIDIAFQTAAEAAPGVKLFYNDYNDTNPEKSKKIYKLLKGMLDRDVPVSGIGLQSHYNVGDTDFDQIKRAYDMYASLGIDMHITELDVSAYVWGDVRKDISEPTAEMTEKVADFYGKFFALLREYKGCVKSVTTWGVSDDTSWLNNFPVRGRKNWPLLFNKRLEPKEAFFRITEF